MTALAPAVASAPPDPATLSRAALLLGRSPLLPPVTGELRRRGFAVAQERSLVDERPGDGTGPTVVTAFVAGADELARVLDVLPQVAPHARLLVSGADDESLARAVDRTETAPLPHLERLPSDADPTVVVSAIERAHGAITAAAWADLMVAADPAMHRLLELAARAAQTDATILLEGESGTGKEVLARAIHRVSARRDAAFVGINCAALPEQLAESELFGHERGAFTGAVGRRRGRFELADGGTLLLDEAGEMSLALQAKLLRVLEQSAVERVGGSALIPFDTRIIATTNRDLEREVESGNFRLDLFYRLNVLRFEIPPLRQRPADIRALAHAFLPDGKRLSVAALTALEEHDWPGNVRELGNVLRRAAILSDGETIGTDDLKLRRTTRNAVPRGTLEEVERMCILAALEECGGHRTRAAELLGISIRTLRNRLAEYREAGLAVPEPARRNG